MNREHDLDLTDLYQDLGLKFRLYARFRTKLYPVELLDKSLPKEGNIIDLGCGYGVYANYLALKEKNRHVLGIDINSKRVDTAQKSIKNRRSFFLFYHLREHMIGWLKSFKNARQKIHSKNSLK